jgi:hypothetical protein
VLDGAPVVEHGNLVGVADGGKSVGNPETGAIRRQMFEPFLNECLRVRIHARLCFVENPDGRVFKRRVFFADAEFDAAFADDGIVFRATP